MSGTPLIIVGSVAIDTIHTPTASASDQLGGSATFAALASRYWGAPVVLSAIGQDFPPTLLQRLATTSFDTSHLTVAVDPTHKSFRWEGRYDAHLGTRETIGFDLGVMATEPLQHPTQLTTARFVMMGNYHPARQLQLLPYLHPDAFIATDTIGGWIKHEKAALTQLYRHTHLVALNDEELYLYADTTDIAAALAQIFALGVRYIAVKHGEKGSALYTHTGQVLSVAAYRTEAKDTTGAGDSFLGALMSVLNSRKSMTINDIADAMRYGSAVASITVEAFGIDSLLPATLAEVERRAQALLPTVKIEERSAAKSTIK